MMKKKKKRKRTKLHQMVNYNEKPMFKTKRKDVPAMRESGSHSISRLEFQTTNVLLRTIEGATCAKLKRTTKHGLKNQGKESSSLTGEGEKGRMKKKGTSTGRSREEWSPRINQGNRMIGIANGGAPIRSKSKRTIQGWHGTVTAFNDKKSQMIYRKKGGQHKKKKTLGKAGLTYS